MVVNTNLSEVNENQEKIIIFKKGIPGLEKLHEFIFVSPPEFYPLYFLQSVSEPEITLPVINPFDIDDMYNANINQNDLNELMITGKDDTLILSVVVIPSDISKMTVNMAAPIVINTKKLKGKQVIPDNSNYSIREPLYKTYLNLKNGGVDYACAVQKK